MIGVIALLLFLGLDLAIVVVALLWLSDRRSRSDRTDARFTDRRRLRY
jgi:hypothetical protein